MMILPKQLIRSSALPTTGFRFALTSCFLMLLSACALVNPPVLDNSRGIEEQVDEYYKAAKIEATVLSALVGGGIGALACMNESGGVIAACTIGGAALGAGVGYTAFSLASGEEEAKKKARETDEIGYMESELQAEKQYLLGFQKETLAKLAALRQEVKLKRAEVAAGTRSDKDIKTMQKEIEKSKEKVKELLAQRKKGMSDIETYCKDKSKNCSGTLQTRRKALEQEIVKLEKQIDNEYALVEKELQA